MTIGHEAPPTFIEGSYWPIYNLNNLHYREKKLKKREEYKGYDKESYQCKNGCSNKLNDCFL